MPTSCELQGLMLLLTKEPQGTSEQGEILPTLPFSSHFHCFLANGPTELLAGLFPRMHAL